MKRILIVDEEVVFLRGARKVLQGSGYQVDTAETVAEAKALLAGEAYDGVITELQLFPRYGEEGLEIARLARSGRPALRVVLMTSGQCPEMETRMTALGVRACFEKPVAIELLCGALEGAGGAVWASPNGEERRK
jgi:two-component system response regulator GlrR